MACFDDDVVADLECRYSEGETPTWEEFYKWIEDIQDGFSDQDHTGAGAGYGGNLAISVISGLQSALDALDARLDAIEAGYATKAYADQAEADAKIYADTLVLDMATMTWAGSEFYTQGELNIVIGNLSGGIEANAADIVLVKGRLDTIELDYATQTWVGTYHYTKTEMNSAIAVLDGKIEDNYDDIVALDSRVGYIEIWYATQDFCTTNFRLKSTCNSLMGQVESDIDDLDSRIWDIESDYTTEWEAYQQGEAAFNDSIDDEIWEHENDCNCYNQCG